MNLPMSGPVTDHERLMRLAKARGKRHPNADADCGLQCTSDWEHSLYVNLDANLGDGGLTIIRPKTSIATIYRLCRLGNRTTYADVEPKLNQLKAMKSDPLARYVLSVARALEGRPE